MEIMRLRNVFFFVICLLSTVGHYYGFLHVHKLSESAFLVPKGDAVDYTETAHNVLVNGCYCRETVIPRPSNFQTEKEEKALYYAFRTPGYVPIYMVSYLVSASNTNKVITILEILLFSLAKALLLVYFSKRFRRWFFSVLLLLIVNALPFVHFFTGRLLTENFAVSFLLFATFAFPWNSGRHDGLRVFLSGLFMLEAILLRPFLLPLSFLFLLWFIKQGSSIRLIAIYSASFFCFFTFWIARNFAVTQQVIVLSSTFKIFDAANKSFIQQRELCQLTGEEFSWYGKENIVAWFNNATDTSSPQKYLPKAYFTNNNTIGNLYLAKKQYLNSLSNEWTLNERRTYEVSSAQIIQKTNVEYQRNSPLDRYFFSTLRLFGQMIEVPLQKPFIGLPYPFNVLSVYTESFLLHFVIVFGLLSCFYLAYRGVGYISGFLIVVVFFVIFLFVFFVRTLEVREFYIPLFCLTALSICGLQQLFERKKYIMLFLGVGVVVVLAALETLQTIKW